ncbi:MAG: ECF transporter S component [Eubacteriales bacterium]
MNKNRHETILKLVETAIFAAIVLIIQLTFSSVKIGPVSFSLVLIPIVVGGILIGPAAGAFLGGVFGVVTLIAGITGQDPFTFTLLNNAGTYARFMTAGLCIVKAVAAGWGSAMLYRLLEKKNRFLGVVLAALSAPILNTGIFVLGAFLMYDAIDTVFAGPSGVSVFYFVLVLCAGVNFLVEFGVNVVFIPAIDSIARIVKKKVQK